MSLPPLTHLAACVALVALVLPSLASAQSAPAPTSTVSPTTHMSTNSLNTRDATDTHATNTDMTHSQMTGVDATNTRMNERDRSMQTTTPVDQPNNSADIDLAAAVRKAIVQDDALSLLAHNVKLVAADGVVTLRGPVDSAEEKAELAARVAAVPGVSSVDDQLDINAD